MLGDHFIPKKAGKRQSITPKFCKKCDRGGKKCQFFGGQILSKGDETVGQKQITFFSELQQLEVGIRVQANFPIMIVILLTGFL